MAGGRGGGEREERSPVPSTSCDVDLQSFRSLHPTVLVEMYFQEKVVCDLGLGVKVRQDVAKYPLHDVKYAPVKFEVAMSHGLGGDAFTRKYSLDL